MRTMNCNYYRINDLKAHLYGNEKKLTAKSDNMQIVIIFDT